ncbi:hypothetical protein ACN47E_004551 [Coniothyrium glycines]
MTSNSGLQVSNAQSSHCPLYCANEPPPYDPKRHGPPTRQTANPPNQLSVTKFFPSSLLLLERVPTCCVVNAADVSNVFKAHSGCNATMLGDHESGSALQR